MKVICNYNICTGCGLCASQCPVSCITMKSGKLGHIFPSIDRKKCINCGLCTKNCPALHTVELRASQHAYAAWAKDEPDYRSSTSGGASSVLSQHIIHIGGIVYGCAVLPGAIIEHIRINKKEDLYRIKGSKYVQSSIAKVLPQIKKDVKEKRPVLFIGTPCQVAAVRKLFREVPDNLFLVDLVCHGTPSQKSLHNYLTRHVQLNIVEDIKFRDEKEYVIKVFSKNGIIYKSPSRDKDYYLSAFWNGFSLRDSCFQCRYATPQRCSDITIGDFWGLGKEASCEEIPEHKHGISLVLTNTDKGQALFCEIQNSMKVYERPISEAVNGNDKLKHANVKTTSTSVYRYFQPFLGDKIAYKFVIRLIKLKTKMKTFIK